MFCPSKAQGAVWGPRLTPMWTVRRMPKGFSGALVLTLSMFQVGYFNRSFQRVFRESRTSRLSGGLELWLLSRPQMPSYSKANAVLSMYILYIPYIHGYVEVRALRIRQRKITKVQFTRTWNFTATSNTRKNVDSRRSFFDGLLVSGAKFWLEFFSNGLLTPEMTMTNHLMIDISYQGA